MLQELEAAGVPCGVVPDRPAARLTMDREGIRRLAVETLGLPTSPASSATHWLSCSRRSTGENGSSRSATPASSSR